MARVVRLLRALLRRALGERAQDGAPTLADVTIERAAEPRLWVEFSDGYRTSAPLRPDDCFAFCERHSAWEIESLRRALLSEGQAIYAGMLEDRTAMRAPRRTWVTEQMRRLGLGLALVHRIVQDHGGDVEVQSVPGAGTTFVVSVPVPHA